MHPQYRQGDLLFLRQNPWPTAKLAARRSLIIAVGVAGGHAHRLQAGSILKAPDGARYLEVTQGTQVVHEKHGPITLDPGLWLVVRKREYSPEAIRTVLD